jgi:hypothetical protein
MYELIQRIIKANLSVRMNTVLKNPNIKLVEYLGIYMDSNN